jgi:hypothetical protein
MSNPHVANLEYQVKQSRAVKRLEAENGRLRADNERLRGLLREARGYVCHDTRHDSRCCFIESNGKCDCHAGPLLVRIDQELSQ